MSLGNCGLIPVKYGILHPFILLYLSCKFYLESKYIKSTSINQIVLKYINNLNPNEFLSLTMFLVNYVSSFLIIPLLLFI